MRTRLLVIQMVTALLLLACIPGPTLTAVAADTAAPVYPELIPLNSKGRTAPQAYSGDVSECLPFSKPVAPPATGGTATTATYVTADTYGTAGKKPTTGIPSIPAPPGMPTNISTFAATELTPGVPVEGYLPPNMPGCIFWPGGLWYKVTIDKPQKITGLLLTPPGIDYYLYLYYERNGPGDVNTGTVSFRNYGPYDQVAYVAQPGTYYLFVTEGGTGGSMKQPFNLKVMLSDKYDEYEKYTDDATTTETYYDAYRDGPMIHTIDNPYDEDWKMFNVNPDGELTINLKNPSPKGSYKLELIDQYGVMVGTVYQNTTKTFRLDMYNAYYTRVFATNPAKYDPDVPYVLTMKFKPDPQPICDWDEERPWEWVCTGP
ncbi:hypothetical protein [Paenibacillus wulumuqiensis]|uniref:hypothetical protein n=1 Tax=Paenibacillus wulumuqiensis TaxID=1567107 RepID=UPI000619D3D3|nr:hypothetical protein [Paenibacillus wulumuqiensis]